MLASIARWLITRTLTPFRADRTGATRRTPVEVRLVATGLELAMRVALLAHNHNQTARKERDDHVGEKGIEPHGTQGAIETDAQHQEGERVTPTLACGRGERCTKQTCVMQRKGGAQSSQAEQRKTHDMSYKQ